MAEVLRFHAPGPWITRDLKPCVLASDYDALEAEWMALSQDDGKVERALEAAQARIRDLEAKLQLTEGAFKNTRIRELEAIVQHMFDVHHCSCELPTSDREGEP